MNKRLPTVQLFYSHFIRIYLGDIETDIGFSNSNLKFRSIHPKEAIVAFVRLAIVNVSFRNDAVVMTEGEMESKRSLSCSLIENEISQALPDQYPTIEEFDDIVRTVIESEVTIQH